MTTLKDGHNERRLRRLQEKLTRADARLLHEVQQTQLFMEAIDEQDLQQAQSVIAKLSQLAQLDIPVLKTVIDRVRQDLAKYVGEGELVGAVKGKLRNLVGMKNPLVKAMSLASALETGFNQFGRIIETMIDNPDALDDNKTIADILQGDKDAATKLKTLQQAFVKALRPRGFFAQFTGKIPGFTGTEQMILARDLITGATIGTLKQASHIINSGASATALADDIKDSPMGAGQGGGVGPGEAQPSDAATGTEQTTGTEPTTSGAATQSSTRGGGAEGGKTPSREWLNDFSGYVQRQTGLDQATVNKVLAVVAKNGKLREGRTLGAASAAELLRLLATAGNLTEAVSSGVIRLQVSEDDLRDLMG